MVYCKHLGVLTPSPAPPRLPVLRRPCPALQNGRFDAPDRLFWSVGDCWKSVLSLPSDVKELVPEFYSNDPSFLVGWRCLLLLLRGGGASICSLALPPLGALVWVLCSSRIVLGEAHT